MTRIAIIDYGLGNLHSVRRALEHVAGDGFEVCITDDAAVVRDADRVVFPGQGAARDAMRALAEKGLLDVLRNLDDRPFLGLCLGLQVLFDHTTENNGVDLIGRLPGRVERFPEPLIDAAGQRLKVPHMGWNRVVPVTEHPLWQGIDPDDAWFYFVHGYRVIPEQTRDIAATTEYGETFASCVARGNLFAMQGHPEKSADTGLQLLHNFVRWNGETC